MRLTDKVARDWYIDYSIEKSAIVEYWDIVSLVREEHEEKGALDVDYLRYINTYQEFDELVSHLDNLYAVYVMLISYSGRFSKPFRLLSKYNCKMVFLSWGDMPVTTTAPRLFRYIYRIRTNPINSIQTAFDLILSIAYRRFGIVKRFDIVFAAGSVLSSSSQYAKRVVPFNLCDFDHYSRVKLAEQRVVKGKYAVFLDINLPYQSDLAICGLHTVHAINYYQSLNRFFDLLEMAHNIKVVIAEHPKAKYTGEEYKKRESYRMLTAELVKDAEYVITHTSTALSYAVLNFKSVLFIYTDEMVSIYKNTVIQQIESLALYLKANFYNIDQISDGRLVYIQQPNRERYDLFKYSYLTSCESENSQSAEIFLREIHTL